MTTKRSLARQAVLVAALAFAASAPACESVGAFFSATPATETQPAKPAPATVWGQTAEATLPPPIGILVSGALGFGVLVATTLAKKDSKPKA